MIRQFAVSVLVGFLGLIAVSCWRTPASVYQKSVAEAQRLVEQGETNKAVSVLLKLLDDDQFKGYRSNLLSSVLQLQLSGGDIAGAQVLFRRVADRDLASASSRVGLIEGALAAQQRYDELAAWCTLLQSYRFEEGIIVNLADYHFRALEAGGKASEIPVALAVYLSRVKMGLALPMAQGQFGLALAAGRWADAGKIVAFVEKLISDAPELLVVVAGMKVDLWLACGDRAAADAYVRKTIDQLPNGSVVGILNAVWDADLKAGDTDAAENLAGFVMENVKGRPPVREAAGSVWIKIAAQRAPTPELVRRLVALKDIGYSPSFIVDEVGTVYAKLLDQGTKEDFASLYALCEGFYAGTQNEELRRSLVGMLLDLSFYLEKYEAALKWAETGMKEQDKEETAMLTCKIKAHIALQKGQTQEAVRNFRVFMEYVARDTRDDVDPVDKTMVTKDMILGLNAKRIGDILAGTGDKTEAAKAYAEARDYYKKALEMFPDVTTLENQKVQKQMAEIPGK